MAVSIPVDERVHLTELRASDEVPLVRYLNDRAIYERTLRIPFPYAERDFRTYLDIIERNGSHQGKLVNWVIRDRSTDEAIGGFGLLEFFGDPAHRAEIGYWLARPRWGHGIMTRVVRKMSAWSFAELGLVKLEAHVFADNAASVRVLEKAGFTQEGFLRKHFVKDGRFIDVRLYALLK